MNMCTLTYISDKYGSIITANRDEDPKRSATGLTEHRNAHGELYHIAREPLRGGTNMAIGRKGSHVVLLNGAFEPHEFGKTYRKSRGIMVLESLDYQFFADFRSGYDFDGIEPFTLVHFANGIHELRWDGTAVHYRKHQADKGRIWASAQLYTPAVRQKRDQWFANLLSTEPSADEVFHFHLNGGDGDTGNDMVMNRANLVRTVSVTQVATDGSHIDVRHKDLIHGKSESIQWKVEG